MRRTDVTYGQLDKVLRALGFAYRIDGQEPPARVYEHEPSGAMILLPTFPDTDRVLDHHLATVQLTLDGFGIATPSLLASKLQKAG